MGDGLMTQNTKSSSVTSSTEVDQTDSIEKKQAEPLQQETQAEQEILRKQLSLGRRLLNWRTIVPLVTVIIALIFFARKANIDPQKTWDAIHNANMEFFL